MRAYQSSIIRDDQYMIVIAGDVWVITGDDKMSAGHEYVGEFIRSLMYEAQPIDPKNLPITVIETAQLIALEYYAADWRDFRPYPNQKEDTP